MAGAGKAVWARAPDSLPMAQKKYLRKRDSLNKQLIDLVPKTPRTLSVRGNFFSEFKFVLGRFEMSVFLYTDISRNRVV